MSFIFNLSILVLNHNLSTIQKCYLYILQQISSFRQVVSGKEKECAILTLPSQLESKRHVIKEWPIENASVRWRHAKHNNLALIQDTRISRLHATRCVIVLIFIDSRHFLSVRFVFEARRRNAGRTPWDYSPSCPVSCIPWPALSTVSHHLLVSSSRRSALFPGAESRIAVALFVHLTSVLRIMCPGHCHAFALHDGLWNIFYFCLASDPFVWFSIVECNFQLQLFECKSNYSSQKSPYVPVYKLPDDAAERDGWIAALFNKVNPTSVGLHPM